MNNPVEGISSFGFNFLLKLVLENNSFRGIIKLLSNILKVLSNNNLILYLNYYQIK